MSNNAGLAGLLLILSSFIRGAKMGAFMLVSVAMILFGSTFGLTNYLPADLLNKLHLGGETLYMWVGGGIAALGFTFGRD